MSYAYHEILDIGRQEGQLETRLDAVREVLDVRFPQHSKALDDLLPRCDAEDLKWLLREALRARTTSALRRKLEAQLKGR